MNSAENSSFGSFIRGSRGILLKKVAAGLILLTAVVGVGSSQAQTIQATQLTMVSPAACPAAGCAAGQTVDLRATFDLTAYDPALSPNVQVCFYAPSAWAAEAFRIDSLGGVTGAAYLPDDSQCGPADGNTLLGGVSAQVPAGASGDLLNLGFRIGRTAGSPGVVLIRVYQQNTAGWSQTDSSSTPISVLPTGSSVFTANDAASCGSFSPCYLNSGSDLAGGFGTGLKDAVDSGAATVTVIGSYQVKSSTVLIDKAVTINGQNDARITYTGTGCNDAMLHVTAGATLRSITVTDGSCTSPNRDLITVDSPQDVLLEYVDLVNGQDALKIASSAGSTVVRFSQIMDNSGYAIFRVPGSGGTVQAVGSNLYNNRTGVQADCGLSGGMDHNFWGYSTLPSTAANQCTVNDLKRLGAPVQPVIGGAGVQGERATVTTAKQSAFSGLISYSRSSDGSDYFLNILNHGAGSPENVPFTGGSPGSLIACSNYYDVFLENEAAPLSQLNLSLRYDRLPGCSNTVESADYCAGTDSTRFPLWWYSPSTSSPLGWNTTGSTGQTTTCDTAAREIQVAIDASGRPDFANDLNFVPFVVGLQPLPSSIVITRFVAIPGIGQAAVQWTTASEVNTSGFYVLRSLTSTGGFERVSNFIPHTGTSSSGANYEFVDTGLQNLTYYYRLEIVSTSLGSTFSNVISTTIGLPTFTATFTLTPTASATPTGTITPTGPTPTPTGSKTITPTRTVTLTRLPTRTRTPIRYATFYIFRSPTLAPTRTPFPTRTITPTLTLFPGAKTATQQAIATLLPPVGTSATLNLTTEAAGETPPDTTTQPGTAIAENKTEVSTQSTISASTPGPSPSPTQITGIPTATPSIPGIFTFGQRYWPWILGLLGLELASVGVTAYILIRKKILVLPPPPPPGDDPSI